MKRKYYKKLDVLRAFACISVLMYHVGLLKGGYLAVCTFFVLSGFLACTSAFKRQKFSIIKYYKSRVIKIYVPLLVVVFLSIFVLHFIPGINWFNMKTETTSVIFCYNNFWQIGANLDYFARSASSPFIHFWYVSILMQFDLLFPYFYLCLRKVGDKVGRLAPLLITGGLALISFIFFYNLNTTGNFNSSYYDSFSRLFSLLIGVFAGFLYSYYKDSLFKSKPLELVLRMFLSFLIVLGCLFFSIDSSFYYFPLIMLFVSLISTTLIFYALMDTRASNSKVDWVIKKISNISYEIYLFQYPVIYILQTFIVSKYINAILVIIIVLLLSFLLHTSFNIRWYESEKTKKIKKVIRYIIIFISFIGFIFYVFATNNTLEMKQLEQELSRREEALEISKENFEKNREEETNKHLATLEDYDRMIANIDETIENIFVVGVGDSVMLGATPNLTAKFKNGYFDAEVSRSILKASGLLNDIYNKNMLKGPVVINLGANGNCSKECKLKIITSARENEVFWVTVTNDKSVHINDELKALQDEISNFHIIDWNNISSGHKEYFYADGIHLTPSGRKAYTEAVFDAIKTIYLDKIMSERDKLNKEFEDNNKSKITFIGNDLLLYSFDKLQSVFPSSIFNIDKDYNFTSLKNKVTSLIDSEALSDSVVLVLDSKALLLENQYEELRKLCGDRTLYVVSTNSKLTSSLKSKDHISVIDFSKALLEHKDYLLKDNIHLSDKGNEALTMLLSDTLKEISN